MRLSRPAAAIMAAALLSSMPDLSSRGMAQTPPQAAATQAPDQTSPDAKAALKNPNPLIATVNGAPVHLDDIRAAAQTLPEQARNLPSNVLFPMLINQVIDQKALLIAARKQGLQKQPAVQKVMQDASDTALQNAFLSREIGPKVNDDAVQALYAKTVANKPGEEEVHARHILVPTKADAEAAIKKLDHGADFAKLAKSLSTDKASAGQNGGDLGWFKRGEMLPAFSDAAFALKPGQITQTPVQTRYGWHVIQMLGKRVEPPPPFATVKDQLRQQLIQQNVRDAVQQALAGVKVVRYKPDGTKVTETEQLPPGAKAGSSKPDSSKPGSPKTGSSKTGGTPASH